MAFLKKSSLNNRLKTAVVAQQRDIEVPAGLFRGRDAAGCLLRGAREARTPVPYDPEREKWMSLVGGADIFEVVKRRVSLSDVESRLYSYIDLVVRTSGEIVLVMIRKNDLSIEAPLNADVFDMTAAMYLSGVHSGLVVYFSGEKMSSFFVNPDKKAYKELLEVIISGSHVLFASELRGQMPDGNPGRLCTSCPYVNNCAVSAHGGNSGICKDGWDTEGSGGGNRSAAGERTGTDAPAEQ
jgi:hypothetical protein